ncbi:N-acetylmuramoyl-L-alanine amidase [Lentilactobacillus sp. Marseille-Q4993]|uniref:N-acetylmuramoyl-L-alanine amidase n=1 Tax=Lentilactobacillus sp. Marseille-Q4993 TaxID=3039492 RepID=UPI0024BC2F27|nr:N-acetylmuramoyl-L-alanine amidase [Lentilactobacillus sp. Marseille-Q4993]
MKKVNLVILTLLTTFLVVIGININAQADQAGDLQSAFDQAANEYHVPKSILMAVSYNETLWNNHGFEPSVGGGYGVMHLTDVENSTVSALTTAQTAAKLSNQSLEKVKSDDAANIKAGAALLANYQKSLGFDINGGPDQWYGAVAKYSQDTESNSAKLFADSVFATIRNGASQTFRDGSKVTLVANGFEPETSQLAALKLSKTNNLDDNYPTNLNVQYIPAAHDAFDDKGDYGNYDRSDRPRNGLDIRYIVIHNTETSFDDAIKLFQGQSYAAANFMVRSNDGQIAEFIRPNNVAWHAGNWYVNSHSVGIEHEGYAVHGGKWFTEPMYRQSAKLVKVLASRYNIPLDRQHIFGHDNVPGLEAKDQAGMHWDPGTYWDWNHYFKLLGVDFSKPSKVHTNVITITPNKATNLQSKTEKLTSGKETLTKAGANFVYLRDKPTIDGKLITDNNFKQGKSGTTDVSDWSDKAVYGQQFVKVDQKGDWTAINYDGKKAWFYNPNDKNVTTSEGAVITPAKKTVDVYGGAYPDESTLAKAGFKSAAIKPFAQLKAGQKYVADDVVKADYYNSTLNDETKEKVVSSNESYVQIQFNHRIAYVKKADINYSK